MAGSYANQQVSYLIIGAGIAGLTAAQALRAAGFQVQVVDKARGVGGRMATRRFAGGVFDHGAQYFSVRDSRFRNFVSHWMKSGVVKVWSDGFPTANGEQKKVGSPRYRGAVGMTAVPKSLAEGIGVRLNTRVTAVGVQDDLWQARTASGEIFTGGGMILTPPVPQAVALLQEGGFEMPEQMAHSLLAVRYHPCIALLLLLEKPSRIPAPGGVRVRNGPIRWIADNQQKGISPEAAAVTVHASPEFSRQAWDLADEAVFQPLLAEAAAWIERPIRGYQIHRWRYAQPSASHQAPVLADAGLPPLLFAGDAFGGGRVEGAALTGLEAADWVIQRSVVQ